MESIVSAIVGSYIALAPWAEQMQKRINLFRRPISYSVAWHIHMVRVGQIFTSSSNSLFLKTYLGVVV
jgi:hypothetical protein